MDTFKILHLSDLHIAKRPNEISLLDAFLRGKPEDCDIAPWFSSYHFRRLQQLSVFVQYYAVGLDTILVTGDLATSGKVEDLSRALRFFDSDPIIDSVWFSSPSQGLAATLQREGVPIVLMPGNHDRYQERPPFLPGNRAFDAVFREYWNAGQGVQTQIILEGKTGNNRLAVISADCTLMSKGDATLPFGHLGQGKVRSVLIDRLKEETELVRESSKPTAVIWTLHFPPKPAKISARLKLINDDDLLLSAESNGVECILCGHIHRTMQYRDVAHPEVWVGVAGTACQAGYETCEFSLYEIDVDNGRVVGDPRPEIYQWDGESFIQL